jgi:hypothetical protein
MSRFLTWLLCDPVVGGPPNSWQSVEVKGDQRWAGDLGKVGYVCSFQNDAGEIWLGVEWEGTGSYKWTFSLNATTFRKLAWWYLWRWAVGEWFGLRRRLFYLDLHRRVSQWQRRRP